MVEWWTSLLEVVVHRMDKAMLVSGALHRRRLGKVAVGRVGLRPRRRLRRVVLAR
jgi:hypothetical protein